MAVLTIAAAIVGMGLLMVGLVRGRLPVAFAAAGMFLPIGAYALGTYFMLEGSKHTTFCASCHIMTPIFMSLKSDDHSLASTHYVRGLVPHEEACYTCHSGYGIWGGVDAKMGGIMHMVRTVTGSYELPIKLRGTFDIDSCLGCHAAAPAFRKVAAHQNEELQKQLLAHEISCTGLCHPAAHPASALNGTMPASASARSGEVPAS